MRCQVDTGSNFNLLENAVKYTPKRGSIYISVMEQEVLEKSASGIPEGESLRNIRHRFFKGFTGNRKSMMRDGIGIGLYLARKIVTMQDGYMEVHSESGKGAEFCILSANEIKEVVRTEELKKYYPLGTHNGKSLRWSEPSP